MIYKSFIKRLIDFLSSLFFIVVFSPFFVALILLLKFANKGAGVFFLQERPGLNGRVFKVIKFKTMTDERDESGKFLPDIKRITKVGKFVRATSLDEIPQLFNVLKGDMSLVGPRPLMVKYLPLYNDFQARRHDVKPGITGWAQVNGRNAISWNQKFIYDVYYVDNMSFLFDVKILLLTAKKVFARSGINSSDEAPMKPFMGESED